MEPGTGVAIARAAAGVCGYWVPWPQKLVSLFLVALMYIHDCSSSWIWRCCSGARNVGRHVHEVHALLTSTPMCAKRMFACSARTPSAMCGMALLLSCPWTGSANDVVVVGYAQ